MLYGYELPANFGKVYCNITFGSDCGMGLEIFCYPFECVRLCAAFSVNHRGFDHIERELKSAFVKDVQVSQYLKFRKKSYFYKIHF